MTDTVQKARAKAKEAIGDWQLTRRGINDPGSIPDRLDQIVSIADRALVRINQDIITETDAIRIELSALRFRDDSKDEPSALEHATLVLVRALGQVSHAASLAGFAEAEHLDLPRGVPVPIEAISHQLSAFVEAIESIKPVLEEIERKQSEDRETSAKQSALVGHLICSASIKIDIIGIKTNAIESLDVPGILSLALQLTRLLQSFLATVVQAVSRLSHWLDLAARNGLGPKIAPIVVETSDLARCAAASIGKRGAEKRVLPMMIESSDFIRPSKLGIVLKDGLVEISSDVSIGEVWSFTGAEDEVDLYLRLLKGGQGIFVIHDLDIAPSANTQSVQMAIESKVRHAQGMVERTARALNQRADLFWAVLLVKNADRLTKLPGLKGVSFLRFRSSFAEDRFEIEVDPASLEIFRSQLQYWVNSMEPERTFS
jgi:hypothetical protein